MSVITGHVFDETNEPVSGAIVYAMRTMYFEGKRRLVPAGGGPKHAERRRRAVPDSRAAAGHVLPPRDHARYVDRIDGARGADLWLRADVLSEHDPTCPMRAASAFGVGEESINNDLVLDSRPHRQRIGRGVRFARPAAAERRAHLRNARTEMGAFFSAGNSQVAADGSFNIKNVPPGEYKVMARAGGDKGAEGRGIPDRGQRRRHQQPVESPRPAAARSRD
jgi:hypothetical protein